MGTPLSYRNTGVDIDAGDQLVEDIKPLAKCTMRPEVLGDLGGFGALAEISRKYKNPVPVSGTDGMGTKLKLAFDQDKHDTVNIDLVAVSVNDILIRGAEPLFFLDYFACGRLDVARATDMIKGIAQGCEGSGCALIDGEIAEMPSMYLKGEYDLTGLAVGVVEKGRVINGRSIKAGDIVSSLASDGVHSNGYSLVRKIIARDNPDLNAEFNSGKTLRETIIAPTRLYVKPIFAALEKLTIKDMTHIIGNGIIEDVPRILSENTVTQINAKAWELPKLFQQLRQADDVETQEVYRIFNYGIGMAVVIAERDIDAVQAFLIEQGETVYRLGIVCVRNGDEHQTQVARF